VVRLLGPSSNKLQLNNDRGTLQLSRGDQRERLSTGGGALAGATISSQSHRFRVETAPR